MKQWALHDTKARLSKLLSACDAQAEVWLAAAHEPQEISLRGEKPPPWYHQDLTRMEGK